jgi:hypothetical protein
VDRRGRVAPGLVEGPAPTPTRVLGFIALALLGGAAWFAAHGDRRCAGLR